MFTRKTMVLALATWLLAPVTGCGLFGSEECDCLPTGVIVVIPRPLAATELRLEGEACQGAEVRCGGSGGGGLAPASAENLCTTENHYVEPVAAGLCRITVEFPNRAPFTRDVEIEAGTNGDFFAVGNAFVVVE